MIRRLDPAPRVYPANVVLVRRSDRKLVVESNIVTFNDIEEWLLDAAVREHDTLELVEALIWRLRGASAPIERLSLHIGTLHPQLVGFAWNWNSDDGFCDEVRVADEVINSDAYRLNPLQAIFSTGTSIRRTPQDARSEFPLMAELADSGMTEYLAIPLCGLDARNAVTISTRDENGFADETAQKLERIFKIFALHVQRHSQQRISRNALDVYLGERPAEQVLRGSIKRGAGAAITAVILVADLRNFTEMSDRLPASQMLALLNMYFEAMASAILSHGGEVIKFVGDGLLAVFPIEGTSASPAAKQALNAARTGLDDLRRVQEKPGASSVLQDDWQPLRAGIALHAGEVFFGNIGSSARLDFTVIGPAVNEAYRVEALQKSLGHDILVTDAIARHLDCGMSSLGGHALRGVSSPVSLFGISR
ncbi:adenylate/guanylate cyclase domain-containing protein [Tardiphaga alba]|uniref:Adenylate/guanylate cyclase domain-containing protein n=1 Tax=Tardiphaga alba TaxID=340268 RepID=A0ABX8A394_9BRAD|nr:adenylate/guanylate cyclase domain-containing protein [Tardiphaga alba]QUS38056.1 adenylate/guanylate cyclase domain-containing protein [Tardiphaga alba]